MSVEVSHIEWEMENLRRLLWEWDLDEAARLLERLYGRSDVDRALLEPIKDELWAKRGALRRVTDTERKLAESLDSSVTEPMLETLLRLRTEYPACPGVEEAIERAERKLEEQRESEALQLLEEAERYQRRREWGKAQERLQRVKDLAPAMRARVREKEEEIEREIEIDEWRSDLSLLVRQGDWLKADEIYERLIRAEVPAEDLAEYRQRIDDGQRRARGLSRLGEQASEAETLRLAATSAVHAEDYRNAYNNFVRLVHLYTLVSDSEQADWAADRAEEALTKLREAKRREMDVSIAIAGDHLENGRYDQSLDELRRAETVGETPQTGPEGLPQEKVDIRPTYEQQEEIENLRAQAQAGWEAREEANRNAIEAEEYRKQHDFEECLLLLERARERDPKHPYVDARITEAEKMWRAWTEERIRMLKYQFDDALRDGQFDQASQLLNELRELHCADNELLVLQDLLDRHKKRQRELMALRAAAETLYQRATERLDSTQR
ncbi:MAG: hypothetical protein ACETWB_09180, partial [Anaerolineae bacterium]